MKASKSRLHQRLPCPIDGQDALKGGGGNSQPLGHGNIIFHGFGHTVSADNQHMRTAEQVTAHVDAAL